MTTAAGSSRRPRVAVLPGDGASPGAMAATLLVLRAAGADVEWDELPSGVELQPLPVAERIAAVHPGLDAADSVLLGSTGGITPGVMHLRYGRGTWANLRPVQWRPGFASPYAHPEGIDYLIVRESHEDLYIGFEGDVATLRASGLADTVRGVRMPPGTEGRYAVKVITRDNTERIARRACQEAMARKAQGYPGRLTIGAKTNMMAVTDRFFADVCNEIAGEYDLEVETVIVDDLAHRLALRPPDFDVVLLPNQYGDILADGGAGQVGGMTVTPSGCFGDDFAYFEAPQGAPPPLDQAAWVNPTALLLAGAWMLRHVGQGATGAMVDDAVSAVYAEGRVLPRDQGGDATTEAFAAAVINALPT
ncbi:MAG: isocitrate/isopropylmalate family dehydrogenase [Acidimicrobiales bacterium]